MPTCVTSGPFYKHGLTLIPACISNHKHKKVWCEITHPFPNFNGSTVDILEWISNFIPHFLMDVITYPCWDESMLIKRVTGGLAFVLSIYNLCNMIISPRSTTASLYFNKNVNVWKNAICVSCEFGAQILGVSRLLDSIEMFRLLKGLTFCTVLKYLTKYSIRTVLGPLLLTWINFNHSMDK